MWICVCRLCSFVKNEIFTHSSTQSTNTLCVWQIREIQCLFVSVYGIHAKVGSVLRYCFVILYCQMWDQPTHLIAIAKALFSNSIASVKIKGTHNFWLTKCDNHVDRHRQHQTVDSRCSFRWKFQILFRPNEKFEVMNTNCICLFWFLFSFFAQYLFQWFVVSSWNIEFVYNC